jgi:hypothetical protein
MSLRVIGNCSFAQSGPAKWIPGGLGALDALEIPYQGYVGYLDAFRNSLVRWRPSIVDSNMFLETWPDDGHVVMPTVTLRFIGCKGGILPTPAVTQGSSLTTVSTTDGENQLSVLYRSPHTQVSWIGNSTNNTHAGEFSNTATVTIIERRSGNHIPTVFRLQAQAQYYLARATAAGANPAAIAALQAAIDAQLATLDAPIDAMKAAILLYYNAAFSQAEQAGEFEAVPLVPNRYWACHSITQKVLVPF